MGQDIRSGEVARDERAIGAGQPGRTHQLQPNAIGLVQSTVIAIASSAPGQAMAVSMAAIIAASAYGGGMAVIITTLPMLAIAFAYHRLNLWEQNCGASYVWVGRSINPYFGFMVGWIMLAGWVLATVSESLPRLGKYTATMPNIAPMAACPMSLARMLRPRLLRLVTLR